MGYRSEVAYMVKFYSETNPENAHADYLKFQAWVKSEHKTRVEGDKENNVDFIEFDYSDILKDYNGDRVYLFKWYDADNTLCMLAEWAKWYCHYVDVMWHTELLDKVREYPTGGSRFVRIGEEDQDIEVQDHNSDFNGLYEMIYPIRGIKFSPPDETLNNKEAA